MNDCASQALAKDSLCIDKYSGLQIWLSDFFCTPRFSDARTLRQGANSNNYVWQHNFHQHLKQRRISLSNETLLLGPNVLTSSTSGTTKPNITNASAIRSSMSPTKLPVFRQSSHATSAQAPFIVAFQFQYHGPGDSAAWALQLCEIDLLHTSHALFDDRAGIFRAI
jgi:hypothetical protein